MTGVLVCYSASLYFFYSTPLTCTESLVRRLHLTWRWCCERAEADLTPVPPLKAQSCHDRWVTAARTSSLRWTPGSCCAAGRCPGRWVWTWAGWRSDSWRRRWKGRHHQQTWGHRETHVKQNQEIPTRRYCGVNMVHERQYHSTSIYAP